MRTNAVLPILITTLLLFAGNQAAQAGEPYYQKGEPYYQKGTYQKGYTSNKHGHCCKHCRDDRGTRGARGDEPMFSRAPVGQVVDSVPVTRAVP